MWRTRRRRVRKKWKKAVEPDLQRIVGVEKTSACGILHGTYVH